MLVGNFGVRQIELAHFKKALAITANTHAHKKSWQHLSVCWQSRKLTTPYLVPSMSNTNGLHTRKNLFLFVFIKASWNLSFLNSHERIPAPDLYLISVISPAPRENLCISQWYVCQYKKKIITDIKSNHVQLWLVFLKQIRKCLIRKIWLGFSVSNDQVASD